MKRIYLGIALLVLLLMVACVPEKEGRPGILDLNETTIAQQSARLQSATPPTATRSPTRPPATPTPTAVVIPPTPTYPAVDRDLYVRTTVARGPWTTSYFTTVDGQQMNLDAFQDKVVVVQTLSTICDACREQTETMGLTIQKLLDSRNTGRVVFIILSVDAQDILQDMVDYQEKYGLTENPDVTWIAGLASSSLVNDLTLVFGDELTSRTGGGMFFIDKLGYGHLSDAGLLGRDRLEDVIIHLIGGPGVDEPLPPDSAVPGEPLATEEPTIEPVATQEAEVTEEPLPTEEPIGTEDPT